MMKINENEEYLLHTQPACTWEIDKELERDYPKFVSNYQSKFRDIIEVKKNYCDDHVSKVDVEPSLSCETTLLQSMFLLVFPKEFTYKTYVHSLW